jgi:crotonobetainyl-CoA:carnitine CoA-transferase CaiB-like acyl-CoA transferase
LLLAAAAYTKNAAESTIHDVSLYDASRRWSDSHGDVARKADYAKNLLSGYMVNYNVYQCADNKWVALGL